MWLVSRSISLSDVLLLLPLLGLKPLNYDFNQQFTVKFLGSTDVKEARGELLSSPHHASVYTSGQ